MFQSFDQASDSQLSATRVAALRSTLSNMGFQGFLTPRADAHQGETVAAHDERLAWLTGFTGSAGLAVVLAERAALIVDGRYTLQAAQQIDTDTFEIVASHEIPAADWLASALGGDDRVGFDAWLHGRNEIDRLTTAVEEVGARLEPIGENPIDRIWEDQPPPPIGAVRVQPEDLAGENGSERRARIGEAIRNGGADVAVLSLPDSIAWLLNIRGSDLPRSPVALGFAILFNNGRVDLVMEPDKLDGAVRDHLGTDVRISPPAKFGALLDGLDEYSVLLDSASCPLWIANRLDDAGANIVWGRDPCIHPKAIKNSAELAGMHAAHKRDGVSMVRFLAWLDRMLAAGMTLSEIDIVEKLEEMRVETGLLLDISFDTICGSGPNGAIVHYRVNRASNRTLKPGDLLLVDSGGQYQDGTTDITRTMATGAVPEEVRDPFTRVLKGMIAISRARWPEGLAGRDLDPLARTALWQAGFDYDHGTGHGVGCYLNVHEGPQALSRRSGTVALEPGMVISNEPGYYRPGAFGIRIENLVVVSEPSTPEGGNRAMLGFETLTLAPIDRRLIDIGLLSAPEQTWLNAYHARVLDELGDMLNPDDRAWLADACAPL